MISRRHCGGANCDVNDVLCHGAGDDDDVRRVRDRQTKSMRLLDGPCAMNSGCCRWDDQWSMLPSKMDCIHRR